ncbi:MAG: hypothetical protein QXI93_00865 [Candidatus Methanomethylicia archaeon]
MSSRNDKLSDILILLGAFSLSTWILSTIFLSKDFMLQIIYGLVSSISVVMIFYALKYKSFKSKILLTCAGGLFGTMITLSWIIHDLSLINSMVIAGLGILLLLYGFYGVE